MPYRMYIDECGTDDIKSCQAIEHRHLALTGVIISLADVASAATPGLNDIKSRYFPAADPDETPIVLHRSDFLAAKGRFHCLANQQKMADFQDDLYAWLKALPHTVITVVIDKQAMLGRSHWSLKEPYHYCAEVLAEKFVQFLDRKQSTGDVFAESRKEKKNTALSSHFRTACEKGTRFVSNPERFTKRISSFDIRFLEKKHNNTGLQIADIYAKPSFDRIMFARDKAHTRLPFAIRFGELLHELKYDRRWDGELRGYGMKYMP